MSTAMQQEEKMKLQPAKKKRMNVQGFVNSPYLFAVVPLLLGGFYLLTHPALIQMGVNNPYAIGFILSIPVAIFAIKLVINFFSVIEQWIRLQFEKARGSKKGWFFELVICVFMFVSICEAGPFFNDIQHNMLAGALGYITVLAFDLIAVVCIDSRRKELAKGGSKAGVYLLGVIICAVVSMTANLYSALQNFHVPADPSIPTLLKSVAPYVGIMFPVMIVFLAFSRDADIEVDDAETYRKQQQKRVDFLVVRREILAAVTREMEQIGLLQQREFILKSIFFTRKKMHIVVEIVTGKVMELVNAEIKVLKTQLEQKETAITKQAQTITQQIQTIQVLSNEMKELSATLMDQQNLFAERYQNMAFQMDQITQIRDEILSTNHDFTGSIERQMDVKIRLANSDLQRQIEQIRMASVAHLVANKPENRTDLKTDLEVPNTSKSDPKESDQTNKEIPVNYGLNDAEVQALIMAFPGVKEWFDDTRSSVSESEIIDAANTRLNSLKGAIANHTIKPARGRGNKLQTETVLQWLLGRLKRSANRVRNTGSNATENSNEIQTNREPNTGEMEAIEASNNHHNGNGNGHKTDKLSLDDLTPLEV